MRKTVRHTFFASINKYDALLFMLIVSLIYGRYGLFYPTSILSVLYLPVIMNIYSPRIANDIKPYFYFFCFWIILASFSVFWTPSPFWKKDYFLLLIHSITFLDIIILSRKARSPFSSLSSGWMVAFFLTSLIALWEISSGQHLSTAREEEEVVTNSLGESFEMIYATVTFYNLNTYCYFITFAYPFILYNLSIARNKKSYIFSLILLLLAIYFLFTNGSRGALFSILIMSIMYLIIILWKSSTKAKIYMFLTIVIVGFVIVFWWESIFDYFLFRIEGKNAFEDNARLELWQSSWELFLDSKGLGQGVGSMIKAMQISGNSYYIYYSHNMLLELLLEYGIFILPFFLYFLWLLLKKTLNMNNASRKMLLLGSLFSFPFYSVINSENIRLTFIWCFFASLVVFSGLPDTKIHIERN